MNCNPYVWHIIAKQPPKKFTSSVKANPNAAPTPLSFPSHTPKECLPWPLHPSQWDWTLKPSIDPFLGQYLTETQPIPSQHLIPHHGNSPQPLQPKNLAFITGPDGRPNANLLERAFAFQFLRNLPRRCNLFSGKICAARWHARRRLKVCHFLC